MSSLMQSSMCSDKYIKLAKEISTWSKDPSTKIGAVVVGAVGLAVRSAVEGGGGSAVKLGVGGAVGGAVGYSGA